MTLDNESFALLRAAVQRFIEQRLVPAENRVEENDEVPAEIVEEMKELGMFGLSIPEEYGGIGLSMAQESEVIYDMGHTSFAFRSVFGTNVGIGSQGVLMDGTEEQKRYWLPKFASGEITVSFALTEPGTGSDAASLKTRAVKDGDKYIINGTKRFITNGNRAGAFTLMARTGGEGARGISAFIVPADSPGLSVGKHDKKMGQRGTRTSDVILDDVPVSAENIIGGEPGKGFYTAMKVLDRGRLHIAAQACGMADRLIRDAVNYAKERKQFGQPIAQFQLIQGMLADSQAELYAAKSMLQEASRLYDANPVGQRNDELSMAAACTKMFCTEMVGRVADRAVQIHGGAGYISEYKVERFYRDVRLLRLYEGTTQIQQVIIAKHLIARDGQSMF
ncbi:acyl-CoA dehydrogenase [Verticiella sediminum]|uniref:Acyl-CoA dehydrogenase n=1 Tax=Verticiella sediminum TaxID=1247510 RepID=A0A556AWP0_9BURK|nr:acyl-CoA dehydrogenase family protein [Verticiella sediminum]TSH96805.1 acyl-CoA dehydrogenase [Verticiella sediminum]